MRLLLIRVPNYYNITVSFKDRTGFDRNKNDLFGKFKIEREPMQRSKL